ncbi:MAG: hypothetical protein ABWU11_25240, partial [Arthrospira platensis]
ISQVRRLGKAKRHPTNSGIQIGDRSPFLKFVGWVKRSDTQQIQVYKLGDRSPFLKFVGWVKRSDTQQIQVYK